MSSIRRAVGRLRPGAGAKPDEPPDLLAESATVRLVRPGAPPRPYSTATCRKQRPERLTGFTNAGDAIVFGPPEAQYLQSPLVQVGEPVPDGSCSCHR